MTTTRCPTCGRPGYCPTCGRSTRAPARQYARPPAQGGGWVDAGIIGPGFLIFLVVACVGFWPAMVWHGYGGPTGTDWRWDIHSTIAEAVYFGIIGFVGLLIWAGSRVPASRVPKSLPPGYDLPGAAPVPQPPICLHPNAVEVRLEPPVPGELGELVAWLCPPRDLGGCGEQLDPGFGSRELQPDASWPAVKWDR